MHSICVSVHVQHIINSCVFRSLFVCMSLGSSSIIYILGSSGIILSCKDAMVGIKSASTGHY